MVNQSIGNPDYRGEGAPAAGESQVWGNPDSGWLIGQAWELVLPSGAYFAKETHTLTDPPRVLDLHDIGDRPPDRVLSAEENVAIQSRIASPGYFAGAQAC